MPSLVTALDHIERDGRRRNRRENPFARNRDAGGRRHDVTDLPHLCRALTGFHSAARRARRARESRCCKNAAHDRDGEPHSRFHRADDNTSAEVLAICYGGARDRSAAVQATDRAAVCLVRTT